MRAISIIVVFLAGIAYIADAEAQSTVATPIPLPPRPDFSAMRYFIGTWSCSSKSARRPAPSFGGIVYSFDPAGYVINMAVTHRATPWYPHDHYGTDRIIYDAAAKHWITMITESDGGFAVLDSRGWNGSKLVWRDVTPQSKGDAVHDNDYTITKINDTKYTTATTLGASDGSMISVNGICEKQL